MCRKAVIKRFTAGILALALCFCGLPFTSVFATDTAQPLEQSAQSTTNLNTYSEYIKQYSTPKTEFCVEPTDMTSSENAELLTDYNGRSAVCTKEDGYVEYTFLVQEAGNYALNVEYYPMQGKGTAILRTLWLDGKIPYDELQEIKFRRIWVNENDTIKKDNVGNDIRPRQKEAPEWTNADITDTSGYYTEPLTLYLTQGEHTIRLESVQEPMALGTLTFHPVKEAISYKEYISKYEKKGYSVVPESYIEIQGEDATLKSDSTLYPTSDRVSASVVPNDPTKQMVNTIGGEKYQSLGQWIEWTVPVKEAGFYRLTFKARQNIINGAYSTRTLLINGEIPFKEAAELRFNYDTGWQIVTMQSDGEDLLVWLDKGDNTLRLEVTLGELSELMWQVDSAVQELNDIYQDIYMITGASPDIYFDYQFHKQIPQVIERMAVLSKTMDDCYNTYCTITGQNGEQAQSLAKLARQLKEMSDDPDQIARTLTRFKNNISALGTWLQIAGQQPLEIDYFILSDPECELPKANVNILKRLSFGFKAFLSSFTEDYAMVSGSVDSESDTTITVWLGNSMSGGRDQAQMLKQLVDEQFTVESGVGVEVQLVSMNSLLTAMLAGKGPDVAISLSGSDPVNYAVRNSVLDLTQFEGFDEVESRFYDSALTPMRFNGGVWGLPETQSFYMMFYREDILQELGLELPQTWDDVIEMLPVLQKKQLQFGLPQTIGEFVGIGFYAYAMFLFQNNGGFYYDDGIASALDSNEAIDAFEQWCQFYTEYILPDEYNFVNRFRSGEVPIGIADYTTCNSLSVFAPEIRGRWGFTLVPGTLQEDGSINRAVTGGVTACAIMADTDEPQASWKFLEWWTRDDVQTQYGIELESTLGSAARYAPANRNALQNMPWSNSQLEKILQQWTYVKGVPEVPGGYLTQREVDFAYRSVVYDSQDPGEAIEDAVRSINQEIDNKRREFGLPIHK